MLRFKSSVVVVEDSVGSAERAFAGFGASVPVSRGKEVSCPQSGVHHAPPSIKCRLGMGRTSSFIPTTAAEAPTPESRSRAAEIDSSSSA